MIQAATTENELERLAALYALGQLDTPTEERYDRLTRQLGQLLDVPIAYLAFIDEERQWLKSSVGPMQCEMDRSKSFCTHTIQRPEPMIIPDALEDPRFKDSPLVVGEPKIRFYAGIPLVGPGEHRIGTLCIADHAPRDLTAEDLGILQRFAAIVETSLNQKPKVFLSYSHRDEEWKDRLLRHLSVLERQRLLEIWEDRKIEAGGAWRDDIQEAMEGSNVAVLLVSANYLTSQFILDVEIPHLLQRRDREGIKVIPILIKPCCWDCVDWLARLNLRPTDARPLSGESDDQVDALLATLSAEILQACKVDSRSPAARLASAEAALPSPAPVPMAPLPAAVPAARPDAPAETLPAATVPHAPGGATREEPAGNAGGPVDSVVVLPFADLSASQDQEHFCDGVVDELINTLTAVEGLRVASQISTFQFRSTEIDFEQVRRRIGVTAALQGSVRRAGDRLRISARLVHLDGGFNLWSRRFDGSLDDVFTLQDEVAEGVATALRGTPATERRGGRDRQQINDPEAYELYLKGRHFWLQRTEESLDKCLGFFHQAAAREPGYGRAHAGLAFAYITLSNYGAMAPKKAMPAARKAAIQALELDPQLAEVSCCLGVVEAAYDGHWKDAEDHFRRALEARPYDPLARHWYAVNYLVPLGRFDEAHRELATVVELDPLCLASRTSVGITLYFERRFEEAVACLEGILELASGFPLAHLFLGQTLAEMGAFEAAIEHLEAATKTFPRHSPDLSAAFGYALGRSGDAARARGLLLELTGRADKRYISPGLLAQIAMGMGDKEAALGHLEQAAEVRASDLTWLRVRPIYRDLATEPRFQAVCATLGLRAP